MQYVFMLVLLLFSFSYTVAEPPRGGDLFTDVTAEAEEDEFNVQGSFFEKVPILPGRKGERYLAEYRHRVGLFQNNRRYKVWPHKEVKLELNKDKELVELAKAVHDAGLKLVEPVQVDGKDAHNDRETRKRADIYDTAVQNFRSAMFHKLDLRPQDISVTFLKGLGVQVWISLAGPSLGEADLSDPKQKEVSAEARSLANRTIEDKQGKPTGKPVFYVWNNLSREKNKFIPPNDKTKLGDEGVLPDNIVFDPEKGGFR